MFFEATGEKQDQYDHERKKKKKHKQVEPQFVGMHQSRKAIF